MNLKPLYDHVVLEPLEEEQTTESGIVLPDTADKGRPMQGKVIAVGPGRKNDDGELQELSVKVGDTVLFKKYGPTEVEMADKEYLVAKESDILAIVE